MPYSYGQGYAAGPLVRSSGHDPVPDRASEVQSWWSAIGKFPCEPRRRWMAPFSRSIPTGLSSDTKDRAIPVHGCYAVHRRSGSDVGIRPGCRDPPPLSHRIYAPNLSRQASIRPFRALLPHFIGKLSYMQHISFADRRCGRNGSESSSAVSSGTCRHRHVSTDDWLVSPHRTCRVSSFRDHRLRLGRNTPSLVPIPAWNHLLRCMETISKGAES